MDPYGYFGARRIEGFNALKPAAATKVRSVKSHVVLRVQPKTIIVGNSRPEIGLDPQSPKWPASMRPVYNLSIPGDSLEAQAEQAERAIAATDASSLVWATDFLDFINEPRAQSKPSLVSQQVTSNRIAGLRTELLALVSTQALVDSFWTVFTQGDANAATRTELGFNPARDFISVVKSQGAYILFEQKRRDLTKQLGRTHWTIYDQGSGTSIELKILEELLDFCAKRNVRVVLVINPFHAEYMRIIERQGYGQMHRSWKESVAHIVERSPGAELWDFSEPHPYLDEPPPSASSRAPLHWFWEPSHYRRELGEAMLARMFNARGQVAEIPFGRRVTRNEGGP